MSFQGSLKNYSVAQLLNVIELSRKTGTLTLFTVIEERSGRRSSTGNKRAALTTHVERAEVLFEKGKLIDAVFEGQEFDLLDKLCRAGKVSERNIDTLRRRAKQANDKTMALILLHIHSIDRRDIIESLQRHLADVLHTVLTWAQGSFRFDDDINLKNGHIHVPIDLEDVIVNGPRRIREMQRLTQYLPTLDMSLEFTDDHHLKFERAELTTQEWQVVSIANSGRTLNEVAHAHNLSDMRVRHIVHRLERKGLVKVKRHTVKAEESVVGKMTGRLRDTGFIKAVKVSAATA